MANSKLIGKLVCAAIFLAPLSLASSAQENAVIKTAFRCDDGTVFGATFDNNAETLTVEFPNTDPIVLKQAPSGSGIRYEGNGYEFYGKGKWGNVVRPGQPELKCEEAEAGTAPAPAKGATD
ncbi:MAG: MliC family protein [Methyloligellaceae bacterium]